MTDENSTKPVVPVGTKEADPTLGILSHVVALGVGALAGWLSDHLPGVSLDSNTQLEITGAVVAGVVTSVHYVQAYLSAKKKGA